LALAVLAFLWLFLGFPLASLIAVGSLAYFQPLKKIDALNGVSSKFEQIVLLRLAPKRCVSKIQAQTHTSMSTDALKPFDRTKVRGRVSSSSASGGGVPLSTSAAVSTRPSSSASMNSDIEMQQQNYRGSGISLGGEKGRDESNLLNISGTATSAIQDHPVLITLKTENSEENILTYGQSNSSGGINGLDDLRFDY